VVIVARITSTNAIEQFAVDLFRWRFDTALCMYEAKLKIKRFSIYIVYNNLWHM
jgi:hypothetical protein